MIKARVRRGRQKRVSPRAILIFGVAVAVGVMGTILLTASHAATPTTSIESEAGTVSNMATSIADTTASGSQAVKFGSSVNDSTVMPTSSNTGVPAGTNVTTYNGDYTMSNEGTSISNLHITGDLYMSASNTTATNVIVDGSIHSNMRPGGNYNYPVSTHQTVRYCQAKGLDNVGFDTLTVDHCHLGGVSNTFVQLADYQQGSNYYANKNLTFTNNLLDNLEPYTGTDSPHFEAIHLFAVQGAVIRNNVFDYRMSDSSTRSHITATVTFQDSVYTSQRCTGISFDHNWLYGGGYYQIYATVQGTSSFTNNAFNSYPNLSTQYPPVSGTAFTQSGNMLDGNPFSLTTN